MKPISPKNEGTVKKEIIINRRTNEILNQYSKFTGYTEGEIINMLVTEIVHDDSKFVTWLKGRRFQKRINDLILNDTLEGVDGFEKTDESGNVF